MVDSSFVLWLSLYIGSIFLCNYGVKNKNIALLLTSTILFSVSSFYSFSFTVIIGESGTWVMIGVSIMGLAISLIYTLRGLVTLLKESSSEPKEVVKL